MQHQSYIRLNELTDETECRSGGRLFQGETILWLKKLFVLMAIPFKGVGGQGGGNAHLGTGEYRNFLPHIFN